ncbi:MAG: glycogen-binding domain-containing protein [Myxococcota bacterium]
MSEGDEPLEGLRTERAPGDLMARALARKGARDVRRREQRRLAVAAVVALGIGVAGGWAGGRWSEPAPVPAPAPTTAVVLGADETATVAVRFVYHDARARHVAIAGTFNDWNPEALPMIRGEDGVFYAIVRVPRGRHEYMLVVDGEWKVDPAAPMSTDDGFGRRNGVLEV